MDQLQGSLFYTNYKGKLAAELMNKLRYDGMSLSNHEFDNAPERPCCADPRLTVRMRLSWMRYKFNDARRHKFEKKGYRISNWAVYNESLRQRADMTVWLRFAGGGFVARRAPQNAYDFCPDQANVFAAFIVEAPDYSRNAEGRTDFK